MGSKKLVEQLRKSGLFSELPDAELGRIGKVLRERKFAEDQVIFHQGDPGTGLFIVTQGRVRISTTDQVGREKVLAFCGEGEFFGDMAVLTGGTRSATAQASTPVRALELRKEDFDVLAARNVGIMKEMLQVMAQRQAAMNERLSQEAGVDAGEAKGLTTVVFSPRGGAGKSTLAANLAAALALSSPDRVVLVDLDLLFGHLALMLDVQPRTSLAAISPAALRQIDRESFGYYLVTHADSSLRLMAGTLRPEESELVSAEHVRALIEVLKRQFVHVILDVSSRFSDAVLAAFELADQVLMVCTPDAAAVHDVRQCQRVLDELLHFPRGRIQYVLNQVSPYRSISPENVVQLLGAEFVAEVPFGGEEPARAALEGRPLVMKQPGNPASKAIKGLAQRVDRAAREALALAPQA